MNDLIKVSKENDKITVLGRDLHKFLEIETEYHIWFPRMLEYGFVENVDYIAIVQKRTIGIGKGLTDHQLTLDMAKEISMIQRNEKGKQARQYFIECEKELNKPMTMNELFLYSANRLVEIERKQIEDEERLKVLEAKQINSPYEWPLLNIKCKFYNFKKRPDF